MTKENLITQNLSTVKIVADLQKSVLAVVKKTNN